MYINEENWTSFVKEFSTEDVCCALNYRECMALAYDLFVKNQDDYTVQDFSVRLFFAISQVYPDEWNKDWKNDVFLGKLCSITWRDDERYAYYKKAYDRLEDPPDSLLLLLASCNSTPDTPPISDKESEDYLLRAVNKKITYEAAVMMRGLAQDKRDQNKEAYWNAMCDTLEKNNIHTETIIPDVLLEQNRR